MILIKISIIMPTYNDENHIASSIQSVINQTYSNWELLIMDDGSKDNTEQVVIALNDSRIHYFRQENKGQLVALNNLCPHITGDLVLMLHSDDCLYCNDTLEKNMVHFSLAYEKLAGWQPNIKLEEGLKKKINYFESIF